jgi:hypothetical protein
MLMLAASAALVAAPADRQARATVRIERPARIGAEVLLRASGERRREVVIRHSADGEVRIRLTEFE